MMRRTQLYLGEREYRRAKEKSHRDDTTLSEAIRRLVHLGFEKEREEQTKRSKSGSDRLEHILKSVSWIERHGKKGPSDSSLTVDEILYGRS